MSREFLAGQIDIIRRDESGARVEGCPGGGAPRVAPK